MANRASKGSANKSAPMGDDRTPYQESGEYPDLNTPLNVMGAPGEPGPQVDQHIDGWDEGESAPDPMGFLDGLQGTGGKKKR